MDIRNYYQKVKQVEATIGKEYVVIVSLETPDGGRSGVFTEVSRHAAAKLAIEGKARIADEREEGEYYAQQAEIRRRSQEEEASNRVQVTLVSESDLRSLRVGKAGK
jgi:hypothetical protein